VGAFRNNFGRFLQVQNDVVSYHCKRASLKEELAKEEYIAIFI
jgi:hypothetical protein